MTEQPTPTTKVEVPGIQQWKDRLWEVNRECKSLLMLSNVKDVKGLTAYIEWHGKKELEAILSPGPYSDLELALQLLQDLLLSPSQIEVVRERLDALTVERSTLNAVKAMFE